MRLSSHIAEDALNEKTRNPDDKKSKTEKASKHYAKRPNYQ